MSGVVFAVTNALGIRRVAAPVSKVIPVLARSLSRRLPVADVRSDIGAALTGKLTQEQLDMLMNEVLAITKRVSAEFSCKACHQKQRQMVDVPDAKAVTSALVDLANQAWGRPSEDLREAEGIVFTRKVVYAGTE